MREVAGRAGVSPATVSRVLNGHDNVREDYRARVLQAVAELDYRPNRLARNLRRQRADMIGVVVSDIENPHFSESVRAVEDAAYRHGYRVLLCNTDETPDKQRAYLQMLAQERVLGVILSPSDPASDGIAELLDLGIPVVALDRQVTDERADTVVADNVAAARIATEHLVAAGHRRVGLIAGSPGVETGSERLRGYTSGMRAAGLEPMVASGRFRMEEGRTATHELLADESPPTALVAGNNLTAVGALQALREAGLAVPREVGLVAVDDPFWAELTNPPLTTVAQPVRAMAHKAMSFLLERIEGRRAGSRREVFPVELRQRSSCGVPRAERRA
jgi:DNA-binding LacI/PurR family transcriptional regulator